MIRGPAGLGFWLVPFGRHADEDRVHPSASAASFFDLDDAKLAAEHPYNCSPPCS